MARHTQAADRDLLVRERFDERVRDEVRLLIDDELIAEHAREPFGRHSDRLDRVLAFLRSRPVAGKYVIVCVSSYAQYRIARLTGVRGQRPEFVDEVSFGSIAEAEHAVFLCRVSELDQ